MPRTRYIKPEFFTDTTVFELSHSARLLYIALWTLADRNGVFDADPKQIKLMVFGLDDWVTTHQITVWREELIKQNRVKVATHCGKTYGLIRRLSAHQKFHRDEKPKFPIPLSIFEIDKNDAAPDRCKQPASSLSAACQQRGQRGTGNWELATGNENPTSSELEKSRSAQKQKSFAKTTQSSTESGASSSSAGDKVHPKFEKLSEEAREFLSKTSLQSQTRWANRFEAKWLELELEKATDWIISNPKKAPKSQFARFFTSWLNRNWEKHRVHLKPERKTAEEKAKERWADLIDPVKKGWRY